MSTAESDDLPSSRTYSVKVAGTSKYQKAVYQCSIGQAVSFVPEPTNQHDSRAIAVITEYGEFIGYLPKGGWLTRVLLDEARGAAAIISDLTGGIGDRRTVGVNLNVKLLP